MFEDDLGPALQPTEIARAVPALPAVVRSTAADGDGRSIEIYSDDPCELPQLKRVLTYVQHRLCETPLGDPNCSFYARPEDFDLRYVQLKSHRDGIEILQTGYRLTLLSARFELADDQVKYLREAAHRAASELLLGAPDHPPQAGEWESPPIDPKDPAEIATKIRATLRGQRIKQPFTFTDGIGSTIEFEGSFAGDQEENMCLDPVGLDGYINQATFRGETLSFRLEVEVTPYGERTDELTIEYGPMHLEDVRRLAGDRVQIKSEVRTSRLANGRTRTTYTLMSIEAASSPPFFEEDSDTNDHELLEKAL